MNTPSSESSESRDSGKHTTWQDAKAAYRLAEPPDELEATLLARFGELRAQERLAAAAPAPVAIAKPSR